LFPLLFLDLFEAGLANRDRHKAVAAAKVRVLDAFKDLAEVLGPTPIAFKFVTGPHEASPLFFPGPAMNRTGGCRVKG
jgi:hypothetical protein